MYLIKDLQGAISDNKFKTLFEAVEHLINFHSIDCDMRLEQKLLDAGKIEEAKNAIEQFEWEIIKI